MKQAGAAAHNVYTSIYNNKFVLLFVFPYFSLLNNDINDKVRGVAIF